MNGKKITENIYWVGALDPHLKIFDVVMPTDHGTSYNSYLIIDEKIVLIDTVKKQFQDEFLDNLKSVLGSLNRIDYIVLNHLEPDHSGAIEKLLTFTNAEVIVSKNAKMLLKGMLKRDINPRLVGDDDFIDIGKGRIQFIKAPYLHWPETMLSYYTADKILFPCDFLGAHFCDENIINSINADFFHEFKYYFETIMRPFKKYVIDALNKIENFEIKIIAPSHGPVIMQDPQKHINYYREWAQPKVFDRKKIVICYVSAYGNTEYIAESLKNHFSDKNYSVSIFNLEFADTNSILDEIENADAVLIGSPTINGDALPPVWNLISSCISINTKGKIGAAFGSFGWSGEATKLIVNRLKGLHWKTIDEVLRLHLIVDNRNKSEIISFAEKIEEAL